MKMENIIPANVEGKKNDLDSSVTLPDREQAIKCYKRACKRLLNPVEWHEISGPLSAEVKLCDSKGEELKRLAKVNDLFCIDIPGPGPAAGKGYDWVTVEAIEDETNPGNQEESLSMRLRPCPAPGKEKNEPAHFFHEGATSSFIINRKGNVVIASYHGRNELPNINTDSTADNLRNGVVASGALLALSEVQWAALLKGLLQE
jgi:hypothetical protein